MRRQTERVYSPLRLRNYTAARLVIIQSRTFYSMPCAAERVHYETAKAASSRPKATRISFTLGDLMGYFNVRRILPPGKLVASISMEVQWSPNHFSESSIIYNDRICVNL